ncbi:hypothetical protein L917_11993 [Phytophthora nicotianae]|uniref:Uncharacterized protein n=1 Tax=Phytophthora nicotianae TaxID=4792 RepID=W2KUX4_PHYNI|nr:hypothetical protein L917_11993 [Phytophthora nicotianae]
MPKNHAQPARSTQTLRCAYLVQRGDARVECGKLLSYGGFRTHVIVSHLQESGTSWNKKMYDVYGRCVQPKEPRQDQEEEGRLVKIEKTLAGLEGLVQAIAAKFHAQPVTTATALVASGAKPFANSMSLRL